MGAVWLAIDPLDMRWGTEAALTRVGHVFGSARPHHAYLFTNRRQLDALVLGLSLQRIDEAGVITVL